GGRSDRRAAAGIGPDRTESSTCRCLGRGQLLIRGGPVGMQPLVAFPPWVVCQAGGLRRAGGGPAGGGLAV
ncbi:MAG: hypothetical protein AVDCRST_MAG59-1403, partial [uncultured Thermomicrobiales bacterium]